ncbi:MAG: FecR domain-containing protein [Archangiaceae bacterium]|nr:FecR domain-containing protein [Archangiaceae bacterium]
MIPSGEEVRSGLGSGPSPQARQKQRARFLAEARGRRRVGFRELAIGTLAAAAGSALMVFAWQQRAPDALAPPRLENNAFVFNEASQVYLEPGASAHVVRATGHEAEVVLESGELTVSITSGRKNLWRFRAGENVVIVRGTKFSMLWKPKAQALDVRVREGKVEVHTADGQLRYVTPGEPLAFAPSPPSGERVGVRGPVVEEEPEVEVAEPRVDAAPVKKVAPKSVPASPTVAVVDPLTPALSPKGEREGLRPLAPEWKRQAEGGHYARAVALVEEQGLGEAMRAVGADDLLLFADAARLARRADLGRTVLTSLRERFKGTSDAAEAAFRLGRLEFDAQHFTDAGSWFDLYVTEAPQGAFEGEALGRRLDAWHRAHDPRVGAAADAYLERYPRGP